MSGYFTVLSDIHRAVEGGSVRTSVKSIVGLDETDVEVRLGVCVAFVVIMIRLFACLAEL